MIDSGRFNPARDVVETASEEHFAPDTDQPAFSVAEIAVPTSRSTLFDLGQIDVRWDEELATLWAFMTPHERPNSNLGLIRDTMAWQRESKRVYGGADGSGIKMTETGRHDAACELWDQRAQELWPQAQRE